MHGMDITGDDHVVFSFGSQAAAIRQFILFLQQQWPSLSVDFTEPDLQMTFSGVQASNDCERIINSRERSSLFFYCTEKLREHHEISGYTLNDDGIGPFAVYIKTRRNIEFQIGEVTEIKSDRDMSLSGPPDPYLAWLVSDKVTEITLVTPSSEYESHFSTIILSALITCIRHSDVTAPEDDSG